MYKIGGLIISLWCVQSLFAADDETQLLFNSLKKKDIALTGSLLNAGVEPKCGMLIMCKTRAQAELLVKHGISIEQESKKYGFLPSRVEADADPDLLSFFLQHSSLTVVNEYGRVACRHLISSLPNQKNNLLIFYEKLRILLDHGCYCNKEFLVDGVDIFSDKALDDKREEIMSNVSRICAAYEGQEAKRNIASLLRSREISGVSPGHFTIQSRALLHERYEHEIAQYQQQKWQKARQKRLEGKAALIYVLVDDE